MKKTILNLLLILCISPFLVQCIATKDDIKRVTFRIRTLDNRLGQIEQEVDELKRIASNSARKDSVKEVQKQQARTGDALDRLKTDLLQIKGQLDVSSHRFTKIQKKSKTLQSKLTTELEQITAKTDLIADQLDKTSVEVKGIKVAKAKEAAERARQAAKAAEEAKAKAARAGGPRKIEPAGMKKKWVKGEKSTATATTVRKNPSRALYDKAYSTFKAKQYKKAHGLFTKYAAEYPNGQMLPNVRYWMGDCLFNQNEYELAILEYQKVIADFPDHAKAPAGLMKQGLAFEKLNDYETSKIVFKKLLKEYPKSEQATTARKWLEKK
ncbi:MAG: tol-pal system protein YbgF [Thermodesulfobacteriota bacterium]|nr:tol-pal system protein YbgF [Thermodesulfobacteriota bacterium]